jgi:hypothetical protein
MRFRCPLLPRPSTAHAAQGDGPRLWDKIADDCAQRFAWVLLLGVYSPSI